MLVTLMFIAGGLVNPVQKELDCIYENKAYQLVKEVHDSDPFAVWVTQGTQVAGDFLIMTGAPTVNSTNVYPNLERWHTIDPDRSNESIYNRFAHIYVDLKTTGSAEFSLTFFDAFSVSLTPEDAKQIGIKYVFTTTDLTEKLGFDAARLVSSSGIFKVYELL